FRARLLRRGAHRGLLRGVGGLPRRVEELPHLRVRLAAGGLERVLAHDLGEGLRLAARVDLLARDRRVRRADDLLAGGGVSDLVAAVEARDDGADAEGDQDDAGGDPAVPEEPAHGVPPRVRLTPSTLPGPRPPRIRRAYRNGC